MNSRQDGKKLKTFWIPEDLYKETLKLVAKYSMESGIRLDFSEFIRTLLRREVDKNLKEK